jgi:hypothetical protein
MPSSTPIMLTVADVCPTGIVTVWGTVASVVSLELRVTINSLLISVLRVMVAVAVPVSAIISLSMTTFKEGLSSSRTLRFAVAVPVSKAKLMPV